MHAKPTLVVLLLGIFTAVSAAKAQPPAAVTSGADGARGQATAPSPAAGKALVYVYRPLAHGSVVFSGAKLLRYAQVFVNGDFLAELENSSYASIQAPQGTVAFSSWWSFKDTVAPSFQSIGTGQGAIDGRYFPPDLQWPKCEGNPKKPTCTFNVVKSPENDGYGCARLNWRRLGDARSEDVALCRRELATAAAALHNWLDPGRKRKAAVGGMAAALLLPTALGAASLAGAMSIPGGDFSGWLQVCAPKSFPDPTSQEADKIRRDAKNGDASNVWGHCKNEVAEADRALLAKELLRIEVEAGKTYYVKWHVPYKPGTPLPKMVLVDEATGAAEISALHAIQ